MPIVERYKSPDGLLELLVDFNAGDWSIGFAGAPSHTHGDILAETRGGTVESAIRLYIEDIINSRAVIIISRINGKIRDVWITDDPSQDFMKYAFPGETIERRYWNGPFDTAQGGQH
ncbi:MAG TPA: hypothetical protein VMG59_13765 [Phycisphaerae bacterium]|nr:hypothetical protein [Phycisphaerae bacterium]